MVWGPTSNIRKIAIFADMDTQRLAARRRAFTIWQKLGYLPWSKKKINKSKNGAFYKGAFDSIPFLNDDAKRTFTHLLLRPGYMIRDYIKGQHERYLAPLTSLIIFYAFFALVSSIVNPEYSIDNSDRKEQNRTVNIHFDEPDEPDELEDAADTLSLSKYEQSARRKALTVAQVFRLLSLDQHPELVDTPLKASLAAFESSLRSQGVYLFITKFLFLWLAMFMVLRKRGMGLSACAAISAYVLCQYCFFMFFSLFFADKQGEIGLGLAGVLLMVDYRQLFDIGWKKSLGLTVKTGIYYMIAFIVLVLLLTGVLFIFS